MRVLVIGTEDWAVEQTAGELARNGCEVLTCHDPGEPAFPCNAVLPGRVCPVTAGFEVAVTVRTRPLDEPAMGEMGAICALQVGKPLVSAGMAGRNPFRGWSRRASGAVDLATVVREVAAAEAETSTAGVDLTLST